MRSAVACLCLVLAVGCAVGCGGGSDGRADDVKAIRGTIHGAIRAALVERDPHRACAYASPAGRRLMLHWYDLSYGRRFRTCERVVAFETRNEPRLELSALRRNLGVIGRVRITGATATAQVSDHAGGYPTYVRVSLRKLGGRWLIEDSDAIPRGQ